MSRRNECDNVRKGLGQKRRIGPGPVRTKDERFAVHKLGFGVGYEVEVCAQLLAEEITKWLVAGLRSSHATRKLMWRTG